MGAGIYSVKKAQSGLESHNLPYQQLLPFA